MAGGPGGELGKRLEAHPIDMKYAWTPQGSGLRAELNHLWAELTTTKRVKEFNWTRFYGFLREYEGMAPSTIDERMRHLRRLVGMTELTRGKRGTQVNIRVELTGTVDEIIESFCEFRDARIEAGAGAQALRNDYAAFTAVLRMYRISADVLPKCPPVVPKAKDILPSPEQIHTMVHHDYGLPRKSYELALIQHLLFYDFGFGVRFPSEAWMLQVDAFDPDNHILTVTEPKKGGKVRQLLVDPHMCCAPNRMTLLNYVANWRSKVDPNWEQKAFFLRPDGQPFASKQMMSDFLRKHVVPVYPWFHGYLGRTWHINARLIETGVERESGRWEYDWVNVANWVGHENLNTLRQYYDQWVDVQRQVHGTDWLMRAFIRPDRKAVSKSVPAANSQQKMDALKAAAQARRAKVMGRAAA